MAQNMKVRVCEIPDNEVDFQNRWKALVNHVKEKQSDLIFLLVYEFKRGLDI